MRELEQIFCNEKQFPPSATEDAVLWQRLQGINFHSTTRGDLIVSLIYARPPNTENRGAQGTRGGKAPPQAPPKEDWLQGATVLRQRLAMPSKEGQMHLVGRWRKAMLCSERSWLLEEFQMADGRRLAYRQLEGQFSNPNPEVKHTPSYALPCARSTCYGCYRMLLIGRASFTGAAHRTGAPVCTSGN